MKKALIALIVVLAFATSSFAGVSFLTAPSVGIGNWAVLGMYTTDHQGSIANNEEPQIFDANSLGVRGEYGVMKDVDLLVSYSMDTLPNLKDIDCKQTSANTLGLGAKYSFGKQTIPLIGTVVDMAVAGGYQSSNVGIKADAGGSTSVAVTKMGGSVILSKKMDNIMPYGSVSLNLLTEDAGKVNGGVTVDTLSGMGLGFNIGCAIGIAKDQAVLVEYNSENQAWSELSKSGHKLDDASAVSVSGISLGYAYMF
jgi:long-subunit fatty acid transport protein